MANAQVFKVIKHFKNDPQRSDLELVEETLPPLKNGEFLAEALYLSVDPYMRMYPENMPLGETMMGEQVAKILESKNPKFPVGKMVLGTFGWRTHTVSDGTVADYNILKSTPSLLPDFGNLPASLGLGSLGMPGITAYISLLEKTRPKAGETLVVSGAAGAVGSVVGQIGKIKACKVIGIAGSDDKCKWLTEELGFDHAINYKTQDVDAELTKVAPEGVDCYYDNVGGRISSCVLRHMNSHGRVTIVGVISKYNQEKQIDDSLDTFIILRKELKVEGFVLNSYLDKCDQGIKQLYQWTKEGKLKYRETITVGFENTFDAFISLLAGGNIGKAIVRI